MSDSGVPAQADSLKCQGNPEHVAAVRRIIQKTEDARQRLVAQGGDQAACAVNVLLAARGFWKSEVPAGFSGESSPGLTLQSAKLDGLTFLGALLDRAQLQRASLTNTRWTLCSMEDTDLTGASMRGAKGDVSASGCSFHQADLSQSELRFPFGPKTPDFTKAKLVESQLELVDALVDHTLTPPVDFSGADLTGAKIKLDVYRAPIFADACLTNCTLMVPHGLDVDAGFSVVQRAAVTVTRFKREEGTKTATSEAKGGCFIATAACGSELADDVVRLRQFRDQVLRRSRIGRGVITTYEILSPPIARTISGSAVARWIARKIIVSPACWIAEFWQLDS